MAKKWDYAALAHQAKGFGGPEKMMAIVKGHSYQQGVKAGVDKTTPFLLVAFAGGMLVSQVPKAYRFIRSKIKKDEISDKTAQEAEAELIRSMEAASHMQASEDAPSIEPQPSETEE